MLNEIYTFSFRKCTSENVFLEKAAILSRSKRVKAAPLPASVIKIRYSLNNFIHSHALHEGRNSCNSCQIKHHSNNNWMLYYQQFLNHSYKELRKSLIWIALACMADAESYILGAIISTTKYSDRQYLTLTPILYIIQNIYMYIYIYIYNPWSILPLDQVI